MEKAKAESHVAAVVLPNSRRELPDQVREVIRPKHYSLRTEGTFVQSDFTKRQN